jgi:REP element-mobilizing transposase RayT
MELILLGIMGKAQAKYPALINHFAWMGNHYHIILSGNSKYISPFINIVDGEVAKALKRLYPGLFQSKVWQGRFKEQKLACAQSVIDKIAYTYLNPEKANLVSDISLYPGLSSWHMYRNGAHSIPTSYIPPSKLKPISSKACPRKTVQRLKKLSSEQNTLTLNPDAWKIRFEHSSSKSSSELYSEITQEMQEQRAKFEPRELPPLGAKSLRRMGHAPAYVPEKKSDDRTPFIICKDKELRKILIARYKAFCEECKVAWQRWRLGLISLNDFPKGAYRPAMPLVALRI